MRFTWPRQSADADDLEALQTDVMRFVAILGLCLAAMFSLVRTATVERQSSVATDREAVVPADPSPVPAIEPRPDSQAAKADLSADPREAERDTVPAAKQQVQEDTGTGFTLEFASAEAMQSLLRTGRVKLYVRIDERFWVRDAAGRFVETDPPGEYYRMATDTVPVGLRALLPESGDAAWGVTLPGATVESLRSAMARHDAGRLLIHPGGEVRLEPFQLE